MVGVSVLLTEAVAAGLAVHVDGDRLVVRGPRKCVALAKELLARKLEVMTLLNSRHCDVEGGHPEWGDLAPIVEWFLSAKPPGAPFKLKQGITISNPQRWWADIIADIAAGPEGPRARYGALQDDLWRAWHMFGPQTESSGNA